jgi:hypothetical protein
MFTKRSRYYKVDDVVTSDEHGFYRRRKSLRYLPEVAGQFYHSVESGDRLDRLAYKYYRQSLHWWRICDANPQFLSPRELLGHTPQQTLHLNIRWQGLVPIWSNLFQTVNSLKGMESIIKGSVSWPHPTKVIADDNALFELGGDMSDHLLAAVLAQAVPAVLDLALQGESLNLSPTIKAEQLSDQAWQIEDLTTHMIYRFRYDSDQDLITVFSTYYIYDWTMTAIYNGNNIEQSDIIECIEDVGFEVMEAMKTERLGKNILIPPRVIA